MRLHLPILSRIQFAFIVSFHILFPAFNIGLAHWIVVPHRTSGPFAPIVFKDRNFSGEMIEWLTPFAVFCGLVLIASYVLLVCTWLIWRSEGAWQDWAYHLARTLLCAVVGFILLVSIWTPLTNDGIANRWFSWPNIVFLSTVPLITARLASLLWREVTERREVQPFIWSMGLFLVLYIGLAISVWPYAIPPNVTIWQASSPAENQVFLLIGMTFLIPNILAYTAFSYWLFHSKVLGGPDTTGAIHPTRLPSSEIKRKNNG